MSWSARVFLPMGGSSVNENDLQRLAKCVARTLDRHPEMRRIDTLCILQQGNKISLLGKIASTDLLAEVVACVEQVEGVKAVDTSQVVVESYDLAAVNPIGVDKVPLAVLR